MFSSSSSNPTLGRNAVDRVKDGLQGHQSGVMTVDGLVNKSGILILLVMGAYAFVWNQHFSAVAQGQTPMVSGLIFPLAIVGLITAIAISFKPLWAPFLAPVYALVEGGFLGAISSMLEMRFPGIAFQAAFATISVFIAMLMLYRTGVIKVTERTKSIAFSALMGVFIMGIASWLLGFFGFVNPLYGAGPFGILFSVFMVALAAYFLAIDFDMLKEMVASGAPKQMEWYGSFALLVTLVWLYLEIIILLSKLRGND